MSHETELEKAGTKQQPIMMDDHLGGENKAGDHARKASIAGLHREAKRVAEAEPDPAAAHENADQAAYEGLYSSIDLLGKRMHDAAGQINQIMFAQEDEGGKWKKLDAIQGIHDSIADQLDGLRISVATAKLSPVRSLFRDLNILQGGYDRFKVAMFGAYSKFGGAQSGLKVNFDQLQWQIGSMYTHFGYDPAQATSVNSDERIEQDTEQLENAAIAASEASIHASVQAVKARLGGTDDELHEEVGKLISAVRETQQCLETMDTSRIKSTKKLAKLIAEVDGVIAQLQGKPKAAEQIQRAALHNHLVMIRQYLK